MAKTRKNRSSRRGVLGYVYRPVNKTAGLVGRTFKRSTNYVGRRVGNVGRIGRNTLYTLKNTGSNLVRSGDNILAGLIPFKMGKGKKRYSRRR